MTTNSVSMKLLEPNSHSRERREAGPIDADAAAHFDEAISASRSASGRREGGTADSEGASGETAPTSSTIEVARTIDAVSELLSQELNGLSQIASGQAAQSEASRAVSCGECSPSVKGDALTRRVGSEQHGATGANFSGFANRLAGLDFAALQSGRDLTEDTVARAIGRTIVLDADQQAKVADESADSYRQTDPQRLASLQPGRSETWGLASSATVSDRPAPVPVSVRRRETHFAPVNHLQAAKHETLDRSSGPAAADTAGVVQRIEQDGSDEHVLRANRAQRGASRSIGTIQIQASEIGAAASRRTSAAQLTPTQENAGVPFAQNVSGQIFDAIRQESADKVSSFLSFERTGAASDTNPTARNVASPVRVLTLALAPAELGNLKITLKGGAEEMRIHVEVERSDTVGRIEDERSALIDRLTTIGYKVDDIVITRLQSEAASPAKENGASTTGGTADGMYNRGHSSEERSDAKGSRESMAPEAVDSGDASDVAVGGAQARRPAMFAPRLV